MATGVLIAVFAFGFFTVSSASLNKFYLPSLPGLNGDASNVFQNDLIPTLNNGRCNFYARVVLWESMSKGLYGGDDRRKAKRDHSYGCKPRKYLLTMILLLSGDIALNPGPSSTEESNLEDLTRSRGIKLLHQNICGLISHKYNLQGFCQDWDVIRFMSWE